MSDSCGCEADRHDFDTTSCKYAALKASHAELVEALKTLVNVKTGITRIHVTEGTWIAALKAGVDALEKAEALK